MGDQSDASGSSLTVGCVGTGRYVSIMMPGSSRYVDFVEIEVHPCPFDPSPPPPAPPGAPPPLTPPLSPPSWPPFPPSCPPSDVAYTATGATMSSTFYIFGAGNLINGVTVHSGAQYAAGNQGATGSWGGQSATADPFQKDQVPAESRSNAVAEPF